LKHLNKLVSSSGIHLQAVFNILGRCAILNTQAPLRQQQKGVGCLNLRHGMPVLAGKQAHKINDRFLGKQ
jgi:hypothetical protein